MALPTRNTPGIRSDDQLPIPPIPSGDPNAGMDDMNPTVMLQKRLQSLGLPLTAENMSRLLAANANFNSGGAGDGTVPGLRSDIASVDAAMPRGNGSPRSSAPPPLPVPPIPPGEMANQPPPNALPIPKVGDLGLQLPNTLPKINVVPDPAAPTALEAPMNRAIAGPPEVPALPAPARPLTTVPPPNVPVAPPTVAPPQIPPVAGAPPIPPTPMPRPAPTAAEPFGARILRNFNESGGVRGAVGTPGRGLRSPGGIAGVGMGLTGLLDWYNEYRKQNSGQPPSK